jgi:hypothetical protein
MSFIHLTDKCKDPKTFQENPVYEASRLRKLHHNRVRLENSLIFLK